MNCCSIHLREGSMKLYELVSTSVFFLLEDFEKFFPDAVVRQGILVKILAKQVCTFPQLAKQVKWLQSIIPSELIACDEQEGMFDEEAADLTMNVFGVWIETPDNKIQRIIFKFNFPNNPSCWSQQLIPRSFSSNLDMMYDTDIVPLGHI